MLSIEVTQPTTLHLNSLSPAEKKQVLAAMESSLLGMFGMTRRPSTPIKGKMVHVPKRMRELYEEMRREDERRMWMEGDDNEEEEELGEDRRPLGNTVRSFYHEESSQVGSSEDIEQQHQPRLTFDISSLPSEETHHGAELHLLTHPSTRHNNLPPHRINIFQTPQTGNINATHLLDTKLLHSHQSGWQVFDVSTALRQWNLQPDSNHGLHVEVETENDEVASPVLAHDAPVRLRRSADSSESKWIAEKPYIVTFSDDGKGEQKSNRRRRSKNKKKSKDNKKNRKRRRRTLCQRHSLYVDFDEVGWSDWIVAPPGYNAFYCNGECPFFLPDNLNATNHAIVQSLVHSVDPQAVPRPCCVPTELTSVAMLYINNHEKVVLKTYRDMVVTACGCR